ncbi:MAG: protease SohB [Gammaproteobacteria bacterium]|nr:protease SohB [Gammaproteobacteria bacterium]
MEFLIEYGLFLAKVVTIVVALVVLVTLLISARQPGPQGEPGRLEVKHLNDAYEQVTKSLNQAMMSPEGQKAAQKAAKKTEKQRLKAEKAALKRSSNEADPKALPISRVFVLNFDGDIEASAVSSLRQEVTAILAVASAEDEVLLRLESAGGVVHGYGLAASQLRRITKQGIKLTVSVDKVAASGGYMMACIADRIIAAPFAVLGSIGVVAQVPNFNRLLKSQKVDVELHTAGAHKRTLTMFGENTDEGRQKFRAELEEVHQLFKVFVRDNRPQVDIEVVATGEAWYGQRALEQQLIDEIQTSDEYLIEKMPTAAVYEIVYEIQQSKVEKLVKRFAQLTTLIPTQSRVLARHNLE